MGDQVLHCRLLGYPFWLFNYSHRTRQTLVHMYNTGESDLHYGELFHHINASTKDIGHSISVLLQG